MSELERLIQELCPNGVEYKTTAYKHGIFNHVTCLGNTSSIEVLPKHVT